MRVLNVNEIRQVGGGKSKAMPIEFWILGPVGWAMWYATRG